MRESLEVTGPSAAAECSNPLGGRSLPLAPGALFGAVAGSAGGVAFGAIMALIGFLPTVAALVRSDSPVVGTVVYMTIAAILGAGFGVLASRQTIDGGDLLFWGLIYGVAWWFAGPLTLLPVLSGDPVRWTVADARELFPSLVGHLVYGAVTAAVFAVAAKRFHGRSSRGVDIRTAAFATLAGIVSGLLLSAVLRPMQGGGYTLVITGSFLGAGYGLLFGARREGTGPALIRGTVYGLLWWLVAGLTLPSLLAGDGLDWTAQAAREAVPALPGYLLVGAGTAGAFGLFDGVTRAVLSDDVRDRYADRLIAGGAVSVLHGIVAGLTGGVVFTGVMVAVGFLPTVAALVDSGSVFVGLVVHLLISLTIGVTYAIFFRGRSFDAAAGIGWGVSYGLLWWVLGDLLLLPLLLGQVPHWSAETVAEAFPSLVGHLSYGAVLGLMYQRLEQRVSPPPRSRAAAVRTLARDNQIRTAAPALWSLTVFVAALIPVLVS
ncbi:hypothetical protein [Nocardia macrotermitis]|uniref:Uncharacterized protein n=1 Tax=Nocardia macrotermitis TaxID=2585198 RepID=A0A7K0D305_9NOCA|nr:hypothetical protein [Nocardia macrotermitis]MQY20095.1 hypothetical protein [Nocardia macrotermitis]